MVDRGDSPYNSGYTEKSDWERALFDRVEPDPRDRPASSSVSFAQWK
jgi:hypothetical protein